MNSFAHNPTAAGLVAQQTIQDRVQAAERRALVRDIRAAQRAQRHIARFEARKSGATPPATHPVPWWLFRFVHAAR